MNNFVEVIKACESAGGAGTKNTIRDALATMDETTWKLIWEALNPYRVYGVRKYEAPAKYAEKDGSIAPFFSLLNKLVSRELTGNAARAAVTFGLSTFTEETAKYLARVIDKDLKAGFSDETVNKVLIAREMGGDPEEALKKVSKLLKVEGYNQFSDLKVFPYLIPVFAVQLADKAETEEDFENLFVDTDEEGEISDVKYDGERNVAIVTSEVHYYSRSGKEVFHLPESITEELLKIREHLGYDFALDGERFGKDFEATMNAKRGAKDKSVANEAREGLHFRAFFLMPLTDWKAQKTSITMEEARDFLEDLLPKVGCKKVIISESKRVKNHKEMMEWCNYVIDKLKMEGLIVKKKKDVYRWERNSAWMKVKRFYPVDGRVVGWYYGRKGSRLEKVMGGVIVEGVDEKGRKFRCRVGSGWNDKQREHPQSYEEATLELKYQEMTLTKKNKVSGIHSLRFPTIEKVRTDKVAPALQDRRWFGISLEEAVKITGDEE
jgi:DNA ligase 1